MKRISDRRTVANYAYFPVSEGVKPYSIVMEEGVEKGITIAGAVTQLGVTNDNGYHFMEGSYDRFISEYFEAHKLNMPLDLMHENRFDTLCGVVTSLEKEGNTVKMSAFLPAGLPKYEQTKVLLDNGILQAISNYGYIRDGYYKEGISYIEDFACLSIALVATPGDVGSRLVANTHFRGFEPTHNDRVILQTKKDLSIFGL